MRRQESLQRLWPFLHRIKIAVVPEGATALQLRIAFRNALVVTVLLLCFWVPETVIQVDQSQSRALSGIALDAGHQAAEVGKSLFRSQNLLQRVARDLEEFAESGGSEFLLKSASSTQLDQLFFLNSPSCSGYALVHDGVLTFASKYARPPSGTLPDGTRLNLRSLPGSGSVNGAAIPAVIGPLRASNGITTVLLTATFRWQGKDPAFGVLLAEYNLADLLREHPLLTDEVELVQEICSEDGTHLWGATELKRKHPVSVDLVIPGGKWQILTSANDAWSNSFPKDIYTIGGLGLPMLGCCSYIVWRLSLMYGLLITELQEKSVALRVANRRVQEDLEKVETAQRRLAVSELRTRLIYEQMPVGVGLLEAETGRFLAVNPEACRIFSAAEPELQQRKMQDLLSLSEATTETEAASTRMR
ncbi:MAG: hypothetical protein ACKOEO_15120, partial [Planctomycetaceae bacterium]